MPAIIMTTKNILRAVDMRAEGVSWEQIAAEYTCNPGTVQKACLRLAQKSQSIRGILEAAAAKSRANRKRATAIQHCSASWLSTATFVTPPETRDNELMGTPPLSRSALNEVETDGRGNIAKRKPIRASIGAISIPDIRINNGHHA